MSALNIYLRPDVAESSITSFLESYVLTIGRKLVGNGNIAADSNQSKPVLKVAIQGDGLAGLVITFTVDVHYQYLRSLRIDATVENSTVNSNLTFSQREYLSTTHTRLQNALYSHKLDLASSNSVYQSLVKGIIQTVSSNCYNQPGVRFIQDPTDDIALNENMRSFSRLSSLVDPQYVQDMQLAYAAQLEVQIKAATLALAGRVKSAELQCARLMTLLKPTFQQAGLAVPPVPRQPKPDSTNSNPSFITNMSTSSSKKSLKDASEEGTRLLILRCRRGLRLLDQSNNKLSDTEENANPIEQLRNLLNLMHLFPTGIEYDVEGVSGTDAITTSHSWLDTELLMLDNTVAAACLSWVLDALAAGNAARTTAAAIDEKQASLCYFLQLNRLLDKLHTCLREWSEEECAQRMLIPRSTTQERLEQIDMYRRSLVTTLHSRRMSAGPSTDRATGAILRDRCRIISDDEPLLLEVGASMLSPATLAASSTPSLLDIKTYAAGLLSRTGSLYITRRHVFFYAASLFSAPVMKLFRISDLIECAAVKPIAGGVGGDVGIHPTLLQLRDTGQHITQFQLIVTTPDGCARVASLLQLLLQMFVDDTKSNPGINLASSPSLDEDSNIANSDCPVHVSFLVEGTQSYSQIPKLSQNSNDDFNHAYYTSAPPMLDSAYLVPASRPTDSTTAASNVGSVGTPISTHPYEIIDSSKLPVTESAVSYTTQFSTPNYENQSEDTTIISTPVVANSSRDSQEIVHLTGVSQAVFSGTSDFSSTTVTSATDSVDDSVTKTSAKETIPHTITSGVTPTKPLARNIQAFLAKAQTKKSPG